MCTYFSYVYVFLKVVYLKFKIRKRCGYGVCFFNDFLTKNVTIELGCCRDVVVTVFFGIFSLQISQQIRAFAVPKA